MEITEQYRQLVIKQANELLDTYGQVTAKDVFEVLLMVDISKEEQKKQIKTIASILATAHRQGDLVADYTTKTVSVYHKPLN